MELLVIPSLLAICLKIAIFLRYHESLRTDNLNLGILFLAIFFLNLAELFAIKSEFSQQTEMIILLAYNCSLYFVIHAYINLCFEYTEFKWNVSRVKTALNIVLAGLVLGTILTRSIIADVTPTSGEISPTRVPGDLYWIWQLYIIGGLLFAVSLLIRGLKRTASSINRQKCLVVLISTATPVAMTISTIVLMAMGVNINGAIFISFSLTLMLALMVYAEEKTRLFHLLTFVPFSKERKLHTQLLQQVTDCIAINDDPAAQQSIQLKQMMRDFEGVVVEHVLDYYGGNQKKTASALGVSEATLSRRARACAQQHAKQSSEKTYSTASVRITQ